MENICMLAIAVDDKGEEQLVAVHPSRLMTIIEPDAGTPEMAAMADKATSNGVQVVGFLVDMGDGK